MTRRTPPEKKRLSLERDRRNTYGESPHAARKSIPRRKRQRAREERHAAHVPLAAVDEDALAVDLAAARAARKRRSSWGKTPDKPLGTVIARKQARRERLQVNPRKGRRT